MLLSLAPTRNSALCGSRILLEQAENSWTPLPPAPLPSSSQTRCQRLSFLPEVGHVCRLRVLCSHGWGVTEWPEPYILEGVVCSLSGKLFLFPPETTTKDRAADKGGLTYPHVPDAERRCKQKWDTGLKRLPCQVLCPGRKAAKPLPTLSHSPPELSIGSEGQEPSTQSSPHTGQWRRGGPPARTPPEQCVSVSRSGDI